MAHGPWTLTLSQPEWKRLLPIFLPKSHEASLQHYRCSYRCSLWSVRTWSACVSDAAASHSFGSNSYQVLSLVVKFCVCCCLPVRWLSSGPPSPQSMATSCAASWCQPTLSPWPQRSASSRICVWITWCHWGCLLCTHGLGHWLFDSCNVRFPLVPFQPCIMSEDEVHPSPHFAQDPHAGAPCHVRTSAIFFLFHPNLWYY